MKTIPLPKIFEGRGETRGFKFAQIKSSPYGYIYEVKSSIKPHYEVFKRIALPICLDFINRIYSEDTLKELKPSKNKFGKSAWTTTTLKRAEEILIKINTDGKNRKKDLST